VYNDGYITKAYTYNENKLISEVNSRSFWRKFYYNDNNQLIREEVAVNPDMYSSSLPAMTSYEFVDPEIVGISMYHIYEYDKYGRLIRKLNYKPLDGEDELRSIRTFEYNFLNLINKELLMNGDNEVTQFWIYKYDINGNVSEADYYSYLFQQDPAIPKHLSNTTFKYDSYFNPYRIFAQSGGPGIYTNLNNIIRSNATYYDPAPGLDAESASEFSYEYNSETRFPIRVIDGEEYIYE